MVAQAFPPPNFMPWEAEPYRLWSLIEVMRTISPRLAQSMFRVGALVTNLQLEAQTVIGLRSAAVLSVTATDDPILEAAQAVRAAKDALREALSELNTDLTQIGISPTVTGQLQRLLALFSQHPPQIHAMIDRVHEFRLTLMDELGRHQFMVVAPERQQYYNVPIDWFGAFVVEQFPGSSRDVRDACQCFALACWTASVFHSMRILEHGLRSMAADVGLTGVELENQANIINEIEKKIREIDKTQKKSLQKTERLEFLSQAALNFAHFKDAYRNHVNHSRRSYDEQAADSVLSHTRDFMQRLAKHKRG